MATAVVPDEVVVNVEGRARQRDTMWRMQQRLVGHLAAGRTTDMADAPMPVDPAIYTDPERLAAERAALFRSLPIVAGLSCDIPEPGDVLTFDALDVPIVIARGKDGVARGFLNSCRHRAARVVAEGCTHAARMTCPFHGWTYDLTGALVGLPGKEAFAGIDRDDLALSSVAVSEWHGLIFVRADGDDAPIDVEAFLGPMADEVRQLDLGSVVPIKKTVMPVAANWKFAQDTFFESYHFSTLHPTTIATGAFSNVMIHDAFGPHQRVMVPQRFWQDWVGQPEADWGRVPYQGIHLIFPNTILFVGSLDSMASGGQGFSERQMFGFWRGFPGATPGQSRSLMATYRPAGQSSPEAVADYENLTDYILKVIAEEDYALCAEGQKNLQAAPAGQTLYFGRNEGALQSIHRHIEARIKQVTTT